MCLETETFAQSALPSFRPSEASAGQSWANAARTLEQERQKAAAAR